MCINAINQLVLAPIFCQVVSVYFVCDLYRAYPDFIASCCKNSLREYMGQVNVYD